MEFTYFILFIAIVFLAGIKRINTSIENNQNKNIKTSEQNIYAHSLVMDIGKTLETTEGIEQYNLMKPNLERARRYYKNARQPAAVLIPRDKPQQNTPALKLVK